jgi:hypothetical protein
MLFLPLVPLCSGVTATIDGIKGVVLYVWDDEHSRNAREYDFVVLVVYWGKQ